MCVVLRFVVFSFSLLCLAFAFSLCWCFPGVLRFPCVIFAFLALFMCKIDVLLYACSQVCLCSFAVFVLLCRFPSFPFASSVCFYRVFKAFNYALFAHPPTPRPPVALWCVVLWCVLCVYSMCESCTQGPSVSPKFPFPCYTMSPYPNTLIWTHKYPPWTCMNTHIPFYYAYHVLPYFCYVCYVMDSVLACVFGVFACVFWGVSP